MVFVVTLHAHSLICPECLQTRGLASLFPEEHGEVRSTTTVMIDDSEGSVTPFHIAVPRLEEGVVAESLKVSPTASLDCLTCQLRTRFLHYLPSMRVKDAPMQHMPCCCLKKQICVLVCFHSLYYAQRAKLKACSLRQHAYDKDATPAACCAPT